MKNMELRILCVDWLWSQQSIICSRPYSFPAKIVAEKVGGYAGAVGMVAEEVITELTARGISIRYVRTPRVCYFELL